MFKYDRCDTCLYGYGGERCNVGKCEGCEMLLVEPDKCINGGMLRHCKCLDIDVNERCPYYREVQND